MRDADGLTPQAQKILAVLHNRGNWVTRAELSNALGKQKLIHYDLVLIEGMDAKGMIESRRRRTPQKVVLYEYKAK